MPVFIRTIELFASLFLNQDSSFGYLFIPWHQSKSPFREFFFFVYVFILFDFLWLLLSSLVLFISNRKVCVYNIRGRANSRSTRVLRVSRLPYTQDKLQPRSNLEWGLSIRCDPLLFSIDFETTRGVRVWVCVCVCVRMVCGDQSEMDSI